MIRSFISNLPLDVEPGERLWIDREMNWALAFPKTDPGASDPAPPTLYCRICSPRFHGLAEPAALSWELVRKGWEEFENILARLDQAAPGNNKIEKVQKRAQPTDPREIRY
ncbi:MAG: hypothetical protein A2428_13830 [Bdellovibrionales bacterium RIFOXYC1_FULL_54_43]|nr:MAG: hypothetical protein A2428_13830 [Bdellovibrionales bacterium RIFOXYC1_FULL_54_43]OFZ83559.1 MAG: hypothetical protein A2603_02060 [Bdellovibrionales bacterium RIFOXYD1_FULL_55_31]